MDWSGTAGEGRWGNTTLFFFNIIARAVGQVDWTLQHWQQSLFSLLTLKHNQPFPYLHCVLMQFTVEEVADKDG